MKYTYYSTVPFITTSSRTVSTLKHYSDTINDWRTVSRPRTYSSIVRTVVVVKQFYSTCSSTVVVLLV